jgi:hypothetical protein
MLTVLDLLLKWSKEGGFSLNQPPIRPIVGVFIVGARIRRKIIPNSTVKSRTINLSRQGYN